LRHAQVRIVPEGHVTYFEFFKLAQQIEDLSRSIYLALADHDATPPGLRDLFLGLAAEEEEHGRRLQLLATSQRGSNWANQIVEVAAAGAQTAALQYEAFLVEAKTQRRPGDLMKIIDRLVQMEERLSFVHAEELAQGAGSGAVRLFQSMAKQDRRHQKLLEKVRREQPAQHA
jgi:rubrerythrin